MRAIKASTTGGPEVLQQVEVEEPALGEGQLLINVHATSLNRADLLQRRGLYPPPAGCTDILGLECAGTVSQIGQGADPGWLGKRVMALLPGGGYAERVVIPARMAVEVPDNLSLVQAACVPEAFMTAQEALFEQAGLTPGERVLIHAAAGGVGSAAVQLAALAGGEVIGTAGTEAKCALVSSLGGFAVNHRQRDFAETIERELGAHSVDVIIDFVGSRYWPAHSRLLAPRGRLVVVGLLGGNRPAEVDFGQLLVRQQRIVAMVLRSRSAQEKVALTRRFIRNTLPHVRSGAARPIIDEVFPFSEVRKAHERMEQNDNIGKIVLCWEPSRAQPPS